MQGSYVEPLLVIQMSIKCVECVECVECVDWKQHTGALFTHRYIEDTSEQRNNRPSTLKDVDLGTNAANTRRKSASDLCWIYASLCRHGHFSPAVCIIYEVSLLCDRCRYNYYFIVWSWSPSWGSLSGWFYANLCTIICGSSWCDV